MSDAATILLLEDDPTTRTFLADNLSADGYSMVVAGTLEAARAMAGEQFPDLVIADVQLPDGTGLDLVRTVRGEDGLLSSVDPRTPVLVLSGRGSELDRLRGFDAGCDDYLAKPFSYRELLARVRALLRRCDDRPGRGRLRVGPLEVDPVRRLALLHGERLDLSAKEFALLRVLAAEPQRVFTKDELMRTVWGYRAGASRTLDSHACRLRTKLAAHGDRLLLNVWGVGYRLVDPAVAA